MINQLTEKLMLQKMFIILLHVLIVSCGGNDDEPSNNDDDSTSWPKWSKVKLYISYAEDGTETLRGETT